MYSYYMSLNTRYYYNIFRDTNLEAHNATSIILREVFI